MLQVAHAMGTVANNGLKMKPHLVREVVDVETKETTYVAKEPIGQLSFLPEHLEVIRKSMVGVNIEGTSATSFIGAQYVSAGKTGTAQVFTIKQNEKYNAAAIDERLRDHALFVAFAPADDPKVALAMVVENGGFGAQSAAPIARRVFDFVIMGQYPSQEDIDAVQKGQATRPIGKPRAVASVPWPPKAAELAVEDPIAAASAAEKAASAAAKPASAAAKPASATSIAGVAKPVASGAR
jgi:penicillin-binding protein 2